jgi:lipopolysaccharide transport system permease protein
VSAATPAQADTVPQLHLGRPWTTPAALIGACWRGRDLCWTLARKDFFVRYRRATFGMLWAAALPAIQAVVLSVVLSRVTRIKVDHFSTFIFCGVVMWTYFSASLGTGATSIVDNSAMSSKIYFPRAILPVSACLSALFTLGVSLSVLLVVAAITGVSFGAHTLLIVPAALLNTLFVSSLTLVLAGAHVYFRDVKYFVQAALLLWFYLTPIFYPLSLLHGAILRVVEVNPVAGIIELAHLALFGHADHLGVVLATSLGWTALLLGLAVWIHCRFDRFFADLM